MQKFYSPWLKIPKPNLSATVRLFCIPHSGSGASFYFNWSQYLYPEIELVSIQLPGREDRIDELLITNIDDVVAGLLPDLKNFCDKPYAFFGHSLGSLICFELLQSLSKQSDSLPVHLFVSAKGAPHLQESKKQKLTQLDDDEILAYLRSLQGTDEMILRDPQLLNILLPRIRADLKMNEDYVCSNPGPFEVPITVFGGSEDAWVTLSDLLAWQMHTRVALDHHIFDGGHFYLVDFKEKLINIIKSRLFNKQ